MLRPRGHPLLRLLSFAPLLLRPRVRQLYADIVELECVVEDHEGVSQSLLELGALSVTATGVEDAGDYDCFTERPTWKRAKVSALATKRQAERILFEFPSFQVSAFENKDWLKIQEELRPPLQIGDVRILLPWHQGDGLRIEGGAAFGTGEHATTKMLVEWLQTRTLSDVIDYGCGSGILALVCAKMGATAVGVDIDEDSVEAARRNNAMNGFDVSFQLPPLSDQTADLVIANILLNPLLDLAPTLAALVNDNGLLALSGVRRSQFHTLKATYSSYFHDIAIENDVDEWLLVVCKGKL